MFTLIRWKEMVLILLEEWRRGVKALKQFHVNHAFNFELKKGLVNVFFFFFFCAVGTKQRQMVLLAVKVCSSTRFAVFYVESSSFKMLKVVIKLKTF